eukprot:TRINITY_DN53411_c0_g1_i1.p2 TRINITY_DN53411_c0_g1~~TRINITY_DN53411_c0_g1_i1.p2  ORF type:complete len:236 (+),score=82.59 TRINITY_DN53411_c0_g1_i1:151-858(+)
MGLLKPKLLLLGAPGSGKSFYGKMLSQEYRVPFRSMGKVLRERMPQEVRDRMAQGHLAPAEAVIDVFCSLKDDLGDGYILDGFPRSLEQVALFKEAVRREPVMKPHFALHLALRQDLTVRKLLGRRECASCHANWNVEHIEENGVSMPAILPPNGEHVCTCGTPFSMRPDDTIEVITDRLKTHQVLWDGMQAEMRSVVPVVDYTIMNGSQVAWPDVKGLLDTTMQKLAPPQATSL